MASEPFTFPEVPLDPLPAGNTILVSGPGRIASQFARKLVFGGHDDGIIFVSTSTSGRVLAMDCEASYPELDFNKFGIVDATGRGDIETDTAARIEAVSNTGDLTGISIRNSVLTTQLKEQQTDRIRTCFDSLSLLLLYTNFQTIMRFVHTMDGRIAATDGLGVFVLDPSMHEPQVEYTLKNVCDSAIEIRYEEAAEIRVEGFGSYSREWTPVEL